MDYLKVIWNGFMNPVTKHHLESYFIRKFVKAYKEGVSYRETYDGLSMELGSMMENCKRPYKNEFMKFTVAKIKATFKEDKKLIERINIEASDLLYGKCILDFYKYSNRPYFGVVPLSKTDPNYTDNKTFRFVTKEEYEASTGKEIITYNGFISAQEIDVIEEEVLKAYLYVLKQFVKSNENEENLVMNDAKQESNPFPEIFICNDNRFYNFFKEYLIRNKSDDLFNSVSFLVRKMKDDSMMIESVQYKTIRSFLDGIKVIPTNYEKFIENSSFNSRAQSKARIILYDSIKEKFLSSE